MYSSVQQMHMMQLYQVDQSSQGKIASKCDITFEQYRNYS